MCVSVPNVDICHLMSQPPQHTHTVQCAARHKVVQAMKNIMYNTISLRTQRKRRDVWSLQSYHQNQLQVSKNKPNHNWERTPSLFGAAQNLSTSRNILFTYFQV